MTSANMAGVGDWTKVREVNHVVSSPPVTSEERILSLMILAEPEVPTMGMASRRERLESGKNDQQSYYKT